MNITPTISSETPAYTVIGGQERTKSSGISAVVLNRGAPYPRAAFFEELLKQGFDYVISMEGSRRRFDLDGLSAAFPSVRFVLPAENITKGEEINIAAHELSSPLFMVIWDDLRILRGNTGMIAEKLLNTDENTQKLCTVPVIQDGRLETMPTLIAPLVIKGRVKTVPFVPEDDNQSSLFPFDGIGIYNRDHFLRLGGFDRNYRSFYWQLMDFGFRAHLWGEEIAAATLFRLSYEGSVTPEDATADENIRRFYLRNIAPVFRGDHANLPLRRFPGFLFRLNNDIFGAWDEFTLARSWVNTNRYRFRCDSRTVAELWGDIRKEEVSI